MSRYLRPASSLATFLLTALLLMPQTGCSKPSDSSPKNRLKMAYIGLTCEAPIFVAHEQGFYKEQGLEVELVKTDWDGLREGLGLGRFDANHTLLMYLLKPIEQGLDVKITGGIHTGCLRVQVAVKSGIKDAKELRGKKIGIPTHMGSPPHLFASRVLAAAGIDPRAEKNEVTWLTFPPDVLGKAVEDGRVDAIATSDPIGTILVGMNLVRTIADQADDEPYREEYCCVAVVSGKLGRENPAAAAKVTRALFKASKWVEQNPTAAAKLSVEKKYIAASIELNAQALAKLRYIPGVAKCQRSIEQAAQEMQKSGLLSPTTDLAKLSKRAWLDLDGVNDAWVNELKVARIQGGGRPRVLAAIEYAALAQGCSLCGSCCTIE
jgi:NitT/TauT family transport system substrate-binding protein